MTTTRRTALKQVGSLGLATIIVRMLPVSNSAAACEGDKVARILTNHGHAITLTEIELKSTLPLTLSIKGTSTHDHEITLSADDLSSLREGRPVTIRSTPGGGHTHEVQFNNLSIIAGVIENNHGHTVALTPNELASTETVIVTFQGDAAHSHSLELTALELRAIRSGWRVEKRSSVEADHDHLVTFNGN